MRQLALVTFIALVGLGNVARSEDSPNRDELLKQKLAQLEKLNAEIAALRHEHGNAEIQLDVQVVEVSLTQLKKLGIALPGIGKKPHPFLNEPPIMFHVADGAGLTGIIIALVKDNIAMVVAEPTMVTVEGRRAYFSTGGETITVEGLNGPRKTETRKYTLDLLPVIINPEQVRLELNLRIRDMDPILGATDPTAWGITHEIDMGIQLKLGQTGMVGGPVQQRVEASSTSKEPIKNDVQLLFLVTPTLVEPTEK